MGVGDGRLTSNDSLKFTLHGARGRKRAGGVAAYRVTKDHSSLNLSI